jgi:hypothetical protein
MNAEMVALNVSSALRGKIVGVGNSVAPVAAADSGVCAGLNQGCRANWTNESRRVGSTVKRPVTEIAK